ncbi:HAD-IB family hydrolase [Peptostreptococcus russellii]|uniref:phosphoserine phosphatase n=2 Tax=Peptostreptococcus russellii TaxID=215200 RepID=A0A1H8G8K2_9FIRM|nr:HAD-IB family hydrolase [Peptostreptococcus russellii]MBC2578226.1 HAD-IB family hydrolase [Peptostreptococcus russellii]SEN40179.1 HAD-superfamily subfamily IB hydrolase, TIGR01490 [Peptostreptococcus russellii]
MSTIAAFFDIDGTLYRDSLLIEHFRKLIKYELISKSEWSEHLQTTYNNWDKRQGNYDDYMFEITNQYVNAITGLKKSDIDFASRQVIKLKADRVYKYTRSRIKWHKDKGHKVIFISGSPDYLVEKMAEKYKVDDNIGSGYIVKNGKMTGDIVPMWDSKSKDWALDVFIDKYNIDMSKSYAYGDTNGDISMLSRVGNPIAINPTRELLNHLGNSKELKEKARIIVERKDVIYELSPNVTHIESCCDNY